MTQQDDNKPRPLTKDDFDVIIRIMAAFNGFGDSPSTDDIWWRTDAEYAPVTMMVNCNDLFFWGCADCEEITPEDIDALEKAIADAKAVDDGGNGHLLWVARKRGMRPQGAYYKYFKEGMKALFNECGPERETGFGNPEKAA